MKGPGKGIEIFNLFTTLLFKRVVQMLYCCGGEGGGVEKGN